ncbi:MAG TPA: hypothetical protein VFX97_20280 [Pyrinomonadaceae bacterium]|nr:hypothetical protein [Pyrinomonadaceae bacterium]
MFKSAETPADGETLPAPNGRSTDEAAKLNYSCYEVLESLDRAVRQTLRASGLT